MLECFGKIINYFENISIWCWLWISRRVGVSCVKCARMSCNEYLYDVSMQIFSTLPSHLKIQNSQVHYMQMVVIKEEDFQEEFYQLTAKKETAFVGSLFLTNSD